MQDKQQEKAPKATGAPKATKIAVKNVEVALNKAELAKSKTKINDLISEINQVQAENDALSEDLDRRHQKAKADADAATTPSAIEALSDEVDAIQAATILLAAGIDKIQAGMAVLEELKGVHKTLMKEQEQLLSELKALSEE